MNWNFTPLPRFGRLVIEVTSDGRWAVAVPFEVEAEEGAIDVVRPGFTTDLASIPFFARPIFRTWGKWTRPAVYHDWLYKYHPVSRSEADRRFLKGLEVEGVNWPARKAMYAAVRAGGWLAWSS